MGGETARVKRSPVVAKLQRGGGRLADFSGYSLTERELEFVRATDRFKKERGHHPSWRETFCLLRELGYSKPEAASGAEASSDSDADEREFVNAVNAYKTSRDCRFPRWSEVLFVFESLGYQKVGASKE